MNYFNHTITINPIHSIRVDKYIAEELKLFSRSQVKTRIEKLLINGKKAKLSKKISSGDILEIYYSDPLPADLLPEKMDLSIVFENEDVIVINKPQGLVVHPGSGNYTGTLVNGLIFYCGMLKKNFEGSEIRPGIVHRLDKDTSGIIITAKNLKTHAYLSKQFAASKVKKIYLAIVKGQPPEQFGRIDTHIKRDVHNRKKFRTTGAGGKRAITLYKLLKSRENYSLLLLRPKTGRTHQLRVHLQHIYCPVLGDPLYGRIDKQFPDATLMLHAYTLQIRLPGHKEASTFRAPVPGRFKRMMGEIGFRR